LTFAKWGEHVHDSSGIVVRISFKAYSLVGIKGNEIVKENLIPGIFRVLIIYRLNLKEGKIALAFLWGADLP
jgi:hypothetical protein